MTRKSAFTLIELLVVIAIIGILTAITFPVYSRVKDSAYRNSDASNMNALRTALQLYKTDQGAYPPQLLGYVSYYTSGPDMGDVIPANQLVGALYPKRVESLDSFRPAYVRSTEASLTGVTTAVWPHVDAGHYGGGSDAGCTATPAASCSLQAFTTADGTVSIQGSQIGVTGTPLQFYTVSGYETAAVKSPSGEQRELRYALFWSGYGLTGGSASDATAQLGYSEPSENTVVTWDSYFRDYDASGVPIPSEKRDIVLFLGGSARPFDEGIVYNAAWQTTP